MKNKRVNLLALITLSIFLSLFCGCSGKNKAYSYDLNNITYSKYLYITKTVYYKDRVEIHMEGDNLSISDLKITNPEINAAHISTKNNKLIIYSNNPEQITSLDISYDWWFECRFRYLDSDKYASVWRECVDDGGWLDYEGDEKSFFTQADYDEQEKRVERTFEIAQLINENSNVDIELLGEARESLVDYPDSFSNPDGVDAYGFDYPRYSGNYYWTQIYVEGESFDLLGIHIGDNISDISRVMDEYGFEFSETTDKVYSSKKADHIDVYENEDVHFSFYLNGDELVYMLVSVYSDQPWIHEYN